MFDVGFGELIIVFLVALFVLGPEKLEQFAIKSGQIIGLCRKTWLKATLEEPNVSSQQKQDSADRK